MQDTGQSPVARDLPTVMPAQAGIQGRVALGFKLTWIPAFAGMTETEASGGMSLNSCALGCQLTERGRLRCAALFAAREATRQELVGFAAA